MLIELLNEAFNGVDIEEAIDEIYNIVASYADLGSLGMSQFTSYVERVKADLKTRGIISQEERKRLDDIDDKEIPSVVCEAIEKGKESKRIIESLEISKKQKEELLIPIDASIKANEAVLTKIKEKRDIATPLEIRNKIKMADLWAQQRALVNIVKAAMVVLNKMELVSFDGLEQKTKKELGEEGVRIRKVMDQFRRGEIYDRRGHLKAGQMMVELFDYPVRDITQRTKERDTLKDEDRNALIEREFYQVLRRHEKLCYDSFKCLKTLDSDSVLRIRREFIGKVMDSGWKEFLEENDLDSKIRGVLAQYDKGIVLNEGYSIKELTVKFLINGSNSLRSALEKMDSVNEEFVTLDTEDPLERYEVEAEKGNSRHGKDGMYNPNKPVLGSKTSAILSETMLKSQSSKQGQGI